MCIVSGPGPQALRYKVGKKTKNKMLSMKMENSAFMFIICFSIQYIGPVCTLGQVGTVVLSGGSAPTLVPKGRGHLSSLKGHRPLAERSGTKLLWIDWYTYLSLVSPSSRLFASYRVRAIC